AVHEQQGILVLDSVARQLDFARPLERVAALVHAGVVAALEVADEVDAGPQRPAADVEDVVFRPEALLDEVVELELAEVVPEGRGPSHGAAVPVGIPEAAVALRQRASDAPFHPDGDVLLELGEGRLPVSCQGHLRTLSRAPLAAGSRGGRSARAARAPASGRRARRRHRRTAAARARPAALP